MMYRAAFAILVVTGLAVPARAAEHRLELSGNAGYVVSDGVTFDGVLVNGNVFDSVDPKDGFGYNFTLGYYFSDNFELEGLWSQQKSKLQVGGTQTVDIDDITIDNFMGNFVYNFGEGTAAVRPYLLLGLGATRYGSFDVRTVPVGSNTKFSGSFGAGLKMYPGGGKAGLKLGFRWTPTYIKSDSAGWWCDPYWGCFEVTDPQYSNQFEFTGGITLRF